MKSLKFNPKSQNNLKSNKIIFKRKMIIFNKLKAC